MASKNLLCFEGSHGTFNSYAAQIQKHGFKIKSSSSGLLGKGIYFWKKSDYWCELAIAWVKQKAGSNSYNQLGIIFFCEIKVLEDNFLNIDSEELRNAIYELAKKNEINIYDRYAIAQVSDIFISEMEKKIKNKISVIQGMVTPPGKKHFNPNQEYPIMMLGNPICFAVRETSCISISQSKEFKL